MYELQSEDEGDVRFCIYYGMFDIALYRRNIGSPKQHVSCELYRYTQRLAQLQKRLVIHWYDIPLCVTSYKFHYYLQITFHMQ